MEGDLVTNLDQMLFGKSEQNKSIVHKRDLQILLISVLCHETRRLVFQRQMVGGNAGQVSHRAARYIPANEQLHWSRGSQCGWFRTSSAGPQASRRFI
jgi:hypothetical protein